MSRGNVWVNVVHPTGRTPHPVSVWLLTTRLDYCNAMLAGLPTSTTAQVRRVLQEKYDTIHIIMRPVGGPILREHGRVNRLIDAWARRYNSAICCRKCPFFDILLQQIAESYLLAHASLSKLTRPTTGCPYWLTLWYDRNIYQKVQKHRCLQCSLNEVILHRSEGSDV